MDSKSFPRRRPRHSPRTCPLTSAPACPPRTPSPACPPSPPASPQVWATRRQWRSSSRLRTSRLLATLWRLWCVRADVSLAHPGAIVATDFCKGGRQDQLLAFRALWHWPEDHVGKPSRLRNKVPREGEGAQGKCSHPHLRSRHPHLSSPSCRVTAPLRRPSFHLPTLHTFPPGKLSPRRCLGCSIPPHGQASAMRTSG